MILKNRVLFLGLAVAGVLSFAGTASAEVGKKISVLNHSAPIGIVAAYPATTDYLSVSAPSGYKSKGSFLKVTTSYQAICYGGDQLASEVLVGGVVMDGATFAYEHSVSVYGIISKTYYLVPESKGGPAVPANPIVTVRLTSNLGTGCGVAFGTVVVESTK